MTALAVLAGTVTASGATAGDADNVEASAPRQRLRALVHDLNNPLATIRGFAEFLVEKPDLPPALREPLTLIHEEADRMATMLDAARAGGGAAAPGGTATTPLRILAVDDERPILHFLSATLESWGHTVTVAEDGEAALAAVRRGAFDLVISDLRMPVLDGRTLLDTLAREQPALAERLVFTTGDTVRGDTLEWLARSGRPYLRKPFGLAALREVLAAVAGPVYPSPSREGSR